MTNLSATPIESLRWYESRANYGRGRIVGESKLFLKMGYLSLTWMSAKEWALTLTPKGANAIRMHDEELERGRAAVEERLDGSPDATGREPDPAPARTATDEGRFKSAATSPNLAAAGSR